MPSLNDQQPARMQDRVAPFGTEPMTGHPPPSQSPWKPSTRIAFRFLFVMTALFSALYLAPQLLSWLPFTNRVGQLGQRWLGAVFSYWMPVVRWVARHVLHHTPTRLFVDAFAPSFNQVVSVLCMLVLALLFTVVWSAADRSRGEYRRLYEWLRLYFRFSLGILLVSYGILKVLLNQFGYPPTPTMLETPVGALSLPGILAASMASAPIYQVFVGVVELLAGVLLMIRPTASAGAVLAVGTTANVVVLNYAYHYTMYLLAIAMFVMALILTLPALPRLANAMVLNRAVPPAPQPLLFVKPRVNAAARAIGLTLLVVVLGYQFSSMRTQGFYTPPRPALYGAYEVLSFVRNRDTIPVTAGDSARWHGLTVDPVYLPNTSMAATGTVAFVRDTSIVSISVDTVGRTVTLRSQRNPKQQARFAYSIPAANLLLLSGIDNLDHAIAVAPSPAGGSPTSSSDGQRHPMPEQVDTIYVTLRRIDLHALRLIRRRAWFQ